ARLLALGQQRLQPGPLLVGQVASSHDRSISRDTLAFETRPRTLGRPACDGTDGACWCSGPLCPNWRGLGEEFLYDLKAGPAGGRSDEIGWPQSANLNQVHAAGGPKP